LQVCSRLWSSWTGLAFKTVTLTVLTLSSCSIIVAQASTAVITPEIAGLPSDVSSGTGGSTSAALNADSQPGPTIQDPAGFTRTYGEIALDKLELGAFPSPVVAHNLQVRKFKFKSALLQSFEYLMLQHAFRVADDPSLRYSLAHSPFFHNWFASYKGYNLKRWSDGDDFIVNDVGHPLQGAIANRIFLQNSPAGSTVIGSNHEYWISRLKGMAWAAAFEVQWKTGPLSETSLGNAGGWLYVPGCGFSRSCLNNPKDPRPPTNNTGLSDWIITPIVGTGWILLEDTLDRYIASKVAARHRILGGMILRTALEPSRSFAGLFMGKLPWQSSRYEATLVKPTKLPDSLTRDEIPWTQNRRTAGIHYASVSLPTVDRKCGGCRATDSGMGVVYGYRILRSLSFDSELNYFPGGGSEGHPTLEGLFGAKIGHQGKNWGLFGKVRPGFMYYEKAWTGGEVPTFDSLSRFALDSGGVFEVYPSRRSTLRFDVGMTLLRYLQDYPNPRLSALGSLQSPDYYVNQGNLQISSGYAIRF